MRNTHFQRYLLPVFFFFHVTIAFSESNPLLHYGYSRSSIPVSTQLDSFIQSLKTKKPDELYILLDESASMQNKLMGQNMKLARKYTWLLASECPPRTIIHLFTMGTPADFREISLPMNNNRREQIVSTVHNINIVKFDKDQSYIFHSIDELRNRVKNNGKTKFLIALTDGIDNSGYRWDTIKDLRYTFDDYYLMGINIKDDERKELEKITTAINNTDLLEKQGLTRLTPLDRDYFYPGGITGSENNNSILCLGRDADDQKLLSIQSNKVSNSLLNPPKGERITDYTVVQAGGDQLILAEIVKGSYRMWEYGRFVDTTLKSYRNYLAHYPSGYGNPDRKILIHGFIPSIKAQRNVVDLCYWEHDYLVYQRYTGNLGSQLVNTHITERTCFNSYSPVNMEHVDNGTWFFFINDSWLCAQYYDTRKSSTGNRVRLSKITSPVTRVYTQFIKEIESVAVFFANQSDMGPKLKCLVMNIDGTIRLNETDIHPLGIDLDPQLSITRTNGKNYLTAFIWHNRYYRQVIYGTCSFEDKISFHPLQKMYTKGNTITPLLTSHNKKNYLYISDNANGKYSIYRKELDIQ